MLPLPTCFPELRSTRTRSFRIQSVVPAAFFFLTRLSVPGSSSIQRRACPQQPLLASLSHSLSRFGSKEESPTHGVSTLAIVMAFVCPDGRINLARCPVGRAFLRRPLLSLARALTLSLSLARALSLSLCACVLLVRSHHTVSS